MLPGIPLTRVGRDAKPQGLGRPDYGAAWDPTSGANGVPIGYPAGSRADITTVSNRIDLGPGESRDLLFTAPRFKTGGSNPNIYPFFNRNSNFVKPEAGTKGDGFGGMQTQVQVYPKGGLIDPSRATPSNTQLRPTGLFQPNRTNPLKGTWTYASGTEDL